MQPSKKVAIFTSFSDNPQSYSLNRVVMDQLKMLLSYGYKPTVIVAEPFKEEGIYADKRVTIKRIPLVPVHNEVKKDETFEEDIEALAVVLKGALANIDVVITHDIIYQNAALKHNFAARRVADGLPGLRWLHWIHSATSPVTLANLRPYFSDQYLQIIQKPFPNSFYVFFNHYSIPRIAKNFNISEDIIRVIHHPSDLQDVFGLSQDVAGMVKEKKLYAADAICIYPIRLDRGKQVEYVIKTMAMLKDFNLSVKVIIVDFHSTGGDKLTYRDELKNIAIDYGLGEDELIWTSEYKELWSVEVPHEDVMSLMRLSNVFIMPSVSESYSLVTQEAGLNKCVVVLNQDFPPFRDIFGANAIFRKYSSNIDVMTGEDGFTKTKYGGDNVSDDERPSLEKNYHKETAGMIFGQLRKKPMALNIFLRKYRNLDYIFENELEPLFVEEM